MLVLNLKEMSRRQQGLGCGIQMARGSHGNHSSSGRGWQLEK